MPSPRQDIPEIECTIFGKVGDQATSRILDAPSIAMTHVHHDRPYQREEEDDRVEG